MTGTSTLRERLVTLFKSAGAEHHRAFADVDGRDAQWPIMVRGLPARETEPNTIIGIHNG